MLQLPLATPSWVPWGRVSVSLGCASAFLFSKPLCMMNDHLAQQMSSSRSKPCLNCSELPARKGYLLFHLDGELILPREESSLSVPERPGCHQSISRQAVRVWEEGPCHHLFFSDCFPIETASSGRQWRPGYDSVGGDFCLRGTPEVSSCTETQGLAWLGLCWGLSGDVRHGRGNMRATPRDSRLVNLAAGWTRREGCWGCRGC